MELFHATTIVCVRREGRVVIGSDGQVTLGNTVMKGNARKVRRLGKAADVVAGFAGATADAFTLFELFEQKLEKHNNNLTRAAVEMAKEWRTDRRFGRLEAMLAVADKDASLLISGNGDVVEPEHGLIAIGSGGKTGRAPVRYCSCRLKLTGTRAHARTALPCTIAGWKRHAASTCSRALRSSRA